MKRRPALRITCNDAHSNYGDDPVKIAMISFAYDNSHIIYELKARGSAINCEQWDKLEKINKRITEKISDTS